MAPRPNWKGYLKLSLVSCPVALYPATTTSERVSFRTLNRDTGNRLRRQMVDEQTGDAVETDNQAKGYEVGKGEYIVLDDDELKAVQIESNHTIDIERFVPRAEIDELYLDTPYYLAPTDRVGEEAFAVIREAMRAEKMVGLARVVLFRRERLHDAGAARQGHRRRPRCTMPTRCTRPTPTSRRSPTSSCPRRCWSSPSTSSRRWPASSSRTSSRTATRRP